MAARRSLARWRKVTNAVDAVTGMAFSDGPGMFADEGHDRTPTTSDDTPYVQAVAADLVTIGKTLDTTDDMARLTVIHSRAGTKKVRVYVERSTTDHAANRIHSDSNGLARATFRHSDRPRWENHGLRRLKLPTAYRAEVLASTLKMKSLGMHYKATGQDGNR